MKLRAGSAVSVWTLALVACDAPASSAADSSRGEASVSDAVQCNEPYGYDATPLAGAQGRALLYAATPTGLTKEPPSRSVAHRGTFWFFLETQEDPDAALSVEMSGDLRRIDESTRTCWSYAGRAATQLKIAAGEVGEGSIEVLVNGAPYDSFDLSIREPRSLTIEWQAELGQGRARLRDAQGQPLFAARGISWEVAPVTRSELRVGADGPFVTWDGNIGELQYMAFFGDLSASLALVVDPETGRFTPRQQ